MNKIKILSHQEAQKIAAGEVVERPANIVKELLENSIDAGATNISLYIEKAGKILIRIVDNGCGMSEADANACFLPHATSKITSIDDLVTIQSFGFRGEALASISAVSKVKLITKEQEADNKLGIHIDRTSDGIFSQESVACLPGTDLSIHDLFYNIPVRKKFLKQDETEWNQIQALVHAFCLSHTHLSFKLFNDNKLVLNAPPVATAKERASQIWGYNFSQNLLQLSAQNSAEEKNRFDVQGFISHHHFWRYGKSSMFFFVNQRWVKDHELSKAVLKGYLNVLPPGKFPAAFLFLTVDPDYVDINVHPKKEEVRFLKPHAIQMGLQERVRRTLEDNLTKSLNPQVEHLELESFDAQTRLASYADDKVVENQQDEYNFKDFDQALSNETLVLDSTEEVLMHTGALPQAFKVTPKREFFETQTRFSPYAESNFKFSSAQENVADSMSLETKHTKDTFFTHPDALPRDVSTSQVSYSYKLIGQLFNTYIMLEHDGELVIIDQHAAHERILYEKFLKNFEQRDGTTLLFPELVRLPEHQLQAVLREKEFFAQQGIEIELFGKQEIAIKTAPPKIQSNSLKELITEAADFIEEHEYLDKEVFRKKLHEHVHSHMACKLAVRAGDVLPIDQMQQLISDLQKTEKRFICVHGRPTTWIISTEEIEKKFRRK